MLMIAFGTDVLANATCSAVNVYYFKYVLHREDLVATTASVMLWTGIVAIPLLPVLTKLLGKKLLYWLGSAASIIPAFSFMDQSDGRNDNNDGGHSAYSASYQSSQAF